MYVIREGDLIKIPLAELQARDKILVQSRRGTCGPHHDPDLGYLAGGIIADGTFGRTTREPDADIYRSELAGQAFVDFRSPSARTRGKIVLPYRQALRSGVREAWRRNDSACLHLGAVPDGREHHRVDRSWKLLNRAWKHLARTARRRAASLAESRHLRSEEHTSELQSRFDLVCRLLLEKKKKVMVDHVPIFIDISSFCSPALLVTG